MIYTKKGDSGVSSNIKNISYQKDNVLFELVGTMDELSSTLGLAKVDASHLTSEIIDAYQKEFILLNAYISGGEKFDTQSAVERMEQLINAYSKKVVVSGDFSVSGATKSGAYLDVARTVARRVERIAVKANRLFTVKKEDLAYFNRLSDLLYILARYEDQTAVNSNNKINSVTEEKDCNSVNTGVLNLKSADALIDNVMAKAREMGVLTVCAVCDAGGNLIALKRDNDAYIASIKIAQDKAYTSVSLKMPTRKLENLTKPGDPLYGIQHQDNRIVVFGGGVPLYNGDKIIGGFGVSGGTLEQDTFLGDFADKLFNKKN